MADRCKFQKYQYQVSYDNGSTWENVTPIQVEKGDIIEYMSQDCSEIQTLYRWVDLEGTYLCDGNNKYTRQIQEESYDNGVSWYTSYPTVYQRGTFVGVDEEYCADKFVGHYVSTGDTKCPKWYAWNGYQCVFIDPLKVVKCDGTSALTSSDTKYYTSGYDLVSAEIGDCVISIGNYAFYNCMSLTSINIPSGVTSIGDGAFFRCGSLPSIEIPDSVTTIGTSAFTQCIIFTSIEIPDSVASIGQSAFMNCTSLTSCTIGSGVTTIGQGAFEWCSGLTSIEIPDSVASIGQSAFYNCTSLTSCTIGSGVTSIGDAAFLDCTGLTSVTVNVTTPPTLGSGVFSDSWLIPRSTYPIYVPCESLNMYKASSGWSSYADRLFGIPPCGEPPTYYKLQSVYNNGNSRNVECDGYNLTLSSATTKPSSSSYPYSGMTSAVIGTCIESIGKDAFYLCESLTSIDIPNSVTSIATYAFASCTSLSSITIPDSVTSIGGRAFYYCYSLTSCTLGSGVTSIATYAFASCTSLSSINIPSGVTSIGNYAFFACSSLTSITVNATTPPTLGSDVFAGTNDCPIYVPQASVNAYKSASGWSSYASRIQAIP